MIRTVCVALIVFAVYTAAASGQELKFSEIKSAQDVAQNFEKVREAIARLEREIATLKQSQQSMATSLPKLVLAQSVEKGELTVTAGREFVSVVTATLELPAGQWEVLIVGTGAHSKGEFQVVTDDKTTPVTEDQGAFTGVLRNVSGGARTVRLQVRCNANCRIGPRHLIAIAWR